MDKLQTLMAALPSEIDGALILPFTNRRYYTGFASSAGILLVTRGQSYFITDGRYYEAACQTIDACEVILREDRLMPQLLGLLRGAGVKTLAVESEYTSVKEFREYEEALVGIQLIADDRLSDAIAAGRMIKSEIECLTMARAQAIADRAFQHILGYIQPGRTEREIALELEFFIRSSGADGVAFPVIAASGVNASLPHGAPSDKRVERGDFVVLDFGASVDGYCSDMTRTVAVGAVRDSQRRVYDVVLEAQLAALGAVRAGAVCSEVDRVARDVISAADGGVYREYFCHGLGHGIGLDTHEAPFLHPFCDDVLRAGMVVTVEPGIYVPQTFGVRIEDMVAVTEYGMRNFALSGKELIVI
ncbi:MAG: aminopeptidase P family protein [Oscillospiraceae bacterium]|nr:aminopeptidase P family protein [Oscillospiraceae bacterium]